MGPTDVRRGATWTALTAAVVLLLAGGSAWWWLHGRGPVVPRPGSAAYEEMARAFYHGLAALEVGLLDDARDQFTRATATVPGEPAGWANLGLTQLRLGEVEAAAEPVGRALALAPDDGDLVLLAARMESARGRVDESLVHLRRAVSLDTEGLRARFALAEELERAGQAGADDEAQRLLEELRARSPRNLAVLLERTRLAGKRGDVARLRESVSSIAALAAGWPEPALEQLRGLERAAAAGILPDASRSTVLLRNVLARVPAFTESLGQVRTPSELIAEPLPTFLVMAPVSAAPDPADEGLSYARDVIDPAARGTALLALSADGRAAPAVLVADGAQVRRVGETGPAVPLPAPAGTAFRATAAMLAALDWDHDFITDLAVAGPAGVRIYRQGPGGVLADATPKTVDGPPLTCACTGAWAADLEMDGDVDLVLGVEDGGTLVARNNGDGTWRVLQTFTAVHQAAAFVWVDLDRDLDPDAAFLDGRGRLVVYLNRQAGQFAPLDVPSGPRPLLGLGAADLDADGTFDLVTIDDAGAIRRLSRADGGWRQDDVTAWAGFAGQGAAAGSYRLLTEDLDNNGALDVVASGPAGTRIWLADARFDVQLLAGAVDAEVFAAADVNGDGVLDLLGLAGGVPVRALGRGTRGYHWKSFSTRGQQNAGDQRINAFGAGGQLEVRAGLLWQRQAVTGRPVHVGLGSRSAIDVARIVWPNGVPQAEFGVAVDGVFAAEQRLKGSCPWVFADDGQAMTFVTDFLWRSPLGLRINAQDTAGVVQTEDWVKIRGDQLVPRDGTYDLRITAELWETHFFDHVSLQVIDHPLGTEVFVDERFSAARPQAGTIRAFSPPVPVTRAEDERGNDVTALVAARDGRYLASFPKGAYQGIAPEHYVDVTLPARRPGAGAPTLVALGWVYPTDSSINMAIGQGASVRPSGVVLEALGADGRWRVVDPDVGFPAGKNKTMLIDLSGAGEATRVRLRTNLEVYWDWLAVATPAEVGVRAAHLPLASADLRFRGFSVTTSPRGEAPETPVYDRLANTTPRWRDLEGYYTRFGDVRELLASVDDRYVIMNAGDEMRLRFTAAAEPPAGWRRDFVLVGDGWEKDGDYNTSFSQTVLPLPSHARPAYGSSAADDTLEADPVYRRHASDWERFHTRYVGSSRFVAGLRPGRGPARAR